MIQWISAYIICSISFLECCYIDADWMNSYKEDVDDKYLWRKQMKLGKFYYFPESRGKPVRFKPYWMEKLAQIAFFTTMIDLVILALIAKFTNQGELPDIFLKYIPLVIWMVPALFRVMVDAYVQKREYENRKISRKKAKKVLKAKMISQGFETNRRNQYYKIVEEGYTVFVWMEEHPMEKGICFKYGVFYSNAETEAALPEWCDWKQDFVFSKNPKHNLKEYSIDILNADDDRLMKYFDNDTRGLEALKNDLDVNIEKRLAAVFDREYVLDQYRNNPELFRRCRADHVKKMAGLAGVDLETVYCIRNSILGN